MNNPTKLFIAIEGGSILSKDYGKGLTPAEDILETLPAIVEPILQNLQKQGYNIKIHFVPIYYDKNKTPIFIDSTHAELPEHLQVIRAIDQLAEEYDAGVILRGTDSCENLSSLMSLVGVDIPTLILTSQSSLFPSESNDSIIPTAKLYDSLLFAYYLAREKRNQVGVVDWNQNGEAVLRPGVQVRKISTESEKIFFSREVLATLSDEPHKRNYTSSGISFPSAIDTIKKIHPALQRGYILSKIVEYGEFVPTRNRGPYSSSRTCSPDPNRKIPISRVYVVEGRGNGNLPRHILPFIEHLGNIPIPVLITAEPVDGEANNAYAASSREYDHCIACGTISPSAAVALADITYTASTLLESPDLQFFLDCVSNVLKSNRFI